MHKDLSGSYSMDWILNKHLLNKVFGIVWDVFPARLVEVDIFGFDIFCRLVPVLSNEGNS